MKIERLHSDAIGRHTFPTLFLLDYPGNAKDFWLTFFPALYPPGQIATICRDIVTSIGQNPLHDHDDCSRFGREDAFCPSFVLPDISDSTIGLISETIEALACCLPRSQYLQLIVTSKVLSKVSFSIVLLP